MNDERANTRELMLRALGRGRFAAIDDGRVLAESHTPIFDAARVLQNEGVAGGTVLEARHEGSPVVSMRVTVAAAAALTVEEGRSGPRFRVYRHEGVENARTAVSSGPMTWGEAEPERTPTALLGTSD